MGWRREGDHLGSRLGSWGKGFLGWGRDAAHPHLMGRSVLAPFTWWPGDPLLERCPLGFEGCVPGPEHLPAPSWVVEYSRC